MPLRQFVIMCSVILIGWLAWAFVHQGPSWRDVEPSSAADRVLLENEGLAVSVSP